MRYLSILLIFLSVHLEAKKIIVFKFEKLESMTIDSNERAIIRQWYDIQQRKVKTTTFIFEDSAVYAFEDCKLNLWSYDQNNWVNWYDQHNSGITCFSHLFHIDHKFYLLGGYGLWQGQGLAIEFNPEFQEWKLFTHKGPQEITDYVPEVVYYRPQDSSFYLMYGRHVNQRAQYNSNEFNGYRVNEHGWEPIRSDFDIRYEANLFNPVKTDLLDYAVLNYSGNAREGWYIIEKATQKIFFYPKHVRYNEPLCMVVDGNTIRIDQLEKYEITFDQNLLKSCEEIGEIKIDQTNNYAHYSIGGGVLLIITLGLYWYKKKSKDDDGLNPFYYQILNDKREQFNKEELDVLFKIDFIENEQTRRGRRAKVLKEINEIHLRIEGKELLIRIKNPDDKRYFIYLKKKAE